MENYIPISYLNDFIFCPRSIYFHQIYGGASPRLYRRSPQTSGITAHQSIDHQTYKTTSHILMGIEVYSDRYRLCGKIDTFDTKSGLLCERKKKITQVYDGYIFQLYAQYFCLTEMGHSVKKLKLHSMDDNKNYSILRPEEDAKRWDSFEKLIEALVNYDLSAPFTPHAPKCAHCIYHTLCDYSLC